MIDYSKLDIDRITKVMDQTNPVEILQEVGLSLQDAQAASNGDFSVIGRDLNKPQELDFSVIMTNYPGIFNQNLIEFFFLKAKNQEQFTEEEVETYQSVYKKWFDFVFEIGKYNIFLLDQDLPDSKCINIKVRDDHYGMIIVKSQYFILLQEA